MGNGKLAAVRVQAATADRPVEVEVRGVALEIKPVKDWPVDVMDDIADGKFSSWAKGCLTDVGLIVWQELRPTFGEVEQLFADYNAATGQHPGK